MQRDGGEEVGIGTGFPLLVVVDGDPLEFPTSIRADSDRSRSVAAAVALGHTGAEDRAGRAS